MSSDYPELDPYRSHGCHSTFDLGQQRGYERSLETWNNGTSMRDLSLPLYINPKKLMRGGEVEDIPPQFVLSEGGAALGSADVSQVTVKAH